METTPFADVLVTETSKDSLRVVYLQRLRRLLRLRSEHEQELNRQGLRLMDRAIFAAYCACRDVAAEEQAREILREANITLQRPIGQPDMPDAGAAAGG